MAKPQPKSSVKDVLRIFWNSMKRHKGKFVFVIIAYASTSIFQLIAPLLYKRFFDILTSGDINRVSLVPQLVHVLVLILIVNIASWLAFRAGTFVVNSFESRVMSHLQQQSFNYLIGHSYNFFSNNFTGSLVQRVNRLVRAFERLFDRLIFSIIPLSVLIAGTCIIVWRIKPLFTIAILIWMLVFMSFNFFFSRYKLKYDIERAEADSKSTALLSDNITNHNTIQLFAQVKNESRRYHDVVENQGRIMRFSWNMSGVIDAVQSSLILIIEFFLFYFAIGYWQAGVITIGTFVLIQVYFINLGARLWDFSRIIRDLYEGFADAKEMADIMLEPHEIRDIINAKELQVTEGNIRFNNVVFSFNQTRSVINNLSVEIPGGQKVALIGPSGAGKSTFVRLILRLYNVTDGDIFIDGKNIKDVTQDSLRSHIALVPQDPVLFHRTLMENIRYGKPSATDEEVLDASKLAHCDEFINGLPLKYETFVGERGIKLSGGERQRVAIARAILKNAPILILDEATSSLDSESESLIQDALDTLMKGKTSLVIAHRLSTIRKMDRIIVIDNGKITEDGDHKSLLEKGNSLYGRLWSLQAGGFIA